MVCGVENDVHVTSLVSSNSGPTCFNSWSILRFSPAHHPMPSRSISRLKTDISKKLRPYICLSCRNGVAYQLLASRSRPGLPTWPPSRKTRFYSSVAPTSTVDSRKKKISRGRSTDIPQQYKVLSDALEALIKEGEDYVNKARVRFCRRTLGGSHHRIKIACVFLLPVYLITAHTAQF